MVAGEEPYQGGEWRVVYMRSSMHRLLTSVCDRSNCNRMHMYKQYMYFVPSMYTSCPASTLQGTGVCGCRLTAQPTVSIFEKFVDLCCIIHEHNLGRFLRQLVLLGRGWVTAAATTLPCRSVPFVRLEKRTPEPGPD